MLRRELHGLRMDNNHLNNSSSHSQQGTPSQGPQSGSYASDPYGGSNRTELPPLRSISNSIPSGPDSMTGVQYEGPRVNGFRSERY